MITSAVLYVSNLDRMRAFYAGSFELEVVAQENDFAILGTESWELALVVVRGVMADRIQLSEPPIRREQVPVKLGFVIDSFEAGRPVLERLGGFVDDRSAEWEFRGMRRCDAVDPESNVIQLLERTDRAPTG